MNRNLVVGLGVVAVLLLAAAHHRFGAAWVHSHAHGLDQPHAHAASAAVTARAMELLDAGEIEEALVLLEDAHMHDAAALLPVLRRVQAWRPVAPALSSSENSATHADAPHREDPIRLGTGRHTYEWVSGWGALPEGVVYGNTHGAIVQSANGEVLLNTDSAHAVMVFTTAGKFVRSFAKEFAGGAHGMVLVNEKAPAEDTGVAVAATLGASIEVLYIAHLGRHEVAKCLLDGTVLTTFAWPEASGHYQRKEQFNPTSVAVAPDGTVFVADGYGLSWVHRYDAKGKWLSCFGGRGAEPGQMQTPHGLLLDTRTQPPTLLVADRENHRLQRFDFEGKLLKVISGDLRRPCKMSVHGTDLAVADLAGRVTILDSADKLVTHLGDQPLPERRANNGVPRADWRDGEFIAPHGLAFDRDGNLYIMDWLALGRITKLQRVK